jgi:hypothetical protein
VAAFANVEVLGTGALRRITVESPPPPSKWLITDEGVAVGGAFDRDTATA